MAVPNGLDPTFYSVNLTGGRIRQDKKGSAIRTLQLHNHLNSCDLSNEFKGEFINTTGEVIGSANYWSYQPTGLTGAPTKLLASENVVAVGTGHTVTAGNIYALSGHAQLYGTLNGATVNVAGVIGVIDGAGANTEVLHMAGVQSAVTDGVVNPTAGTLSHFLANSTGTTAIDNLMYVQDSQYITNVFDFEQATGCVTESYTGNGAFAPNSKGTFTQVGQLRIKVGANTYYVPYGTVANA